MVVAISLFKKPRNFQKQFFFRNLQITRRVLFKFYRSINVWSDFNLIDIDQVTTLWRYFFPKNAFLWEIVNLLAVKSRQTWCNFQTEAKKI